MSTTKWDNLLRWIHLFFGFGISVYFGAITFSGDTEYWNNRPEVTNFVATGVLGIVFWSGIIKWQLPRIVKWNRRRKST